jgi:heme/copper-type cytochrome/quinol oxidase subunit 2
MPVVVVAKSEEDYQQWVAEQKGGQGPGGKAEQASPQASVTTPAAEGSIAAPAAGKATVNTAAAQL